MKDQAPLGSSAGSAAKNFFDRFEMPWFRRFIAAPLIAGSKWSEHDGKLPRRKRSLLLAGNSRNQSADIRR